MAEDLAEAILAAVSGEPSQGPPDVFMALVYSTAAISQSEAALEALVEARDAQSADAAIRGTGAAALSGLALYLALSATRRHLTSAANASAPFELAELDRLIEAAQHLRDSVVHWDDKLDRDARTFLAFSDVELVVYAPSGKTGPVQIATLSWEEITDAGRRCRDWARAKVKPPVFD